MTSTYFFQAALFWLDPPRGPVVATALRSPAGPAADSVPAAQPGASPLPPAAVGPPAPRSAADSHQGMLLAPWPQKAELAAPPHTWNGGWR